MDLQETIELLRESLREEENYEKARLAAVLEGSSEREKKREGFLLFPVELEDASLVLDSSWRLRLSFSGDRGLFSTGQPVRYYSGENEIRGVVQSTARDHIDIIVDEYPEQLVDAPGAGLEILHTDTTYRAMYDALRQLEQAGHGRAALTRKRLTGSLESPSLSLKPLDAEEVLPGDAKSSPEEKQASIELSKLNRSQLHAATAMSQTEDFLLIHGPPGTGKTTTLAAGVFLRARRQKERILVCAPTHAAVDVLALALRRYNLDFLRLGHPARIREDLIENTLEYRVENHPNGQLIKKYRKQATETLKKARKFKRNFNTEQKLNRNELYKEYRELKDAIRKMEVGLEDTLIEKTKIFLATPVGSLQKKIQSKIRFTTVILDEAGQIIEPGAWIALLQGETIIMAGDHKQLPPTVLSPGSLLSRTLFEKAIDTHRSDTPDRLFFLDTQYRMSRPIGDFSNGEFYHNALQTDSSVEAREHVEFAPFTSNLVFIDTAGADCTEKSENESIYNPCEMDIIESILRRHTTQIIGPRQWTGAIISTYRNQADRLGERITDLPVESETVDAFQGSQRDWIAISMCRSNEEGVIGFLSEIRRLNVAMTRAKRFLLIVGDSATLSGHPFFERMISFIQARGDYRSIYDPELELDFLL